MSEQELTITLHGREFYSTMYDLELAYQIEELLLSIAGDSLGQLLGVIDSAKAEKDSPLYGLSPIEAAELVMEDSSAGASLDGRALGEVFGGFFRRLRAHGGFFKIAKLVLTKTSEIQNGKKSKINYDTMRGQQILLEDLVAHVLIFNFRDYFFGRAEQLMARFGADSKALGRKLRELFKSESPSSSNPADSTGGSGD